MGFFVSLPIHHFVTKYKLDVFVETGTFIGSGIACARYFPFTEIYSCDISTKLAEDARQMFAVDERVKISTSHSPDFLETLLPKLENNKVLFWLDSHFPDRYDDTVEIDSLEKLIPLKKELEIIRKYRKGNDDVIIIDDARVYDDGNYQYGPFNRASLGNPDMNFIFEFEPTHDIQKDERHEGYFVLTPKIPLL